MKIRILSFTLICALAAVLGVRAAEKETSTELEDKMDEINGAYRKLGRQVADAAKNADSLKQIGIIRTNATAAMKLDPKKMKEVPAADRAKFKADYQAKMKAFVADLDKLEAAFKAGKNDEAANILKTLKQVQEDGHKEFRKEKEKKGKKKAADGEKK
ncbi:MAG: hypothetical protein EXS43_06140 [Opitutus sp.]|nr:hypothetical protein [Opitutus sp.]